MDYQDTEKALPPKFRTGKAFMVLKAGLEPARPNGHRILSPACLPIPPLEHVILSLGLITKNADLRRHLC